MCGFLHERITYKKIIRLKDYVYSKAGYYFITICLKDRNELLWNEPVGARIARPPLSGIGVEPRIVIR